MFQGTHVAPPGRTGVITSQLAGALLAADGTFRTSSNRTGQIITTLDDVSASMSGTFSSGGGAALFPNYPYDHTRSIVAGSLYVSPTGNNANNGLSTSAPKATIAGALSAMGTSSSKIIYLMDGTHVITASMSLASGTSALPFQITGLPGHTPTVNCNNVYKPFSINGSSWWKFSHFRITNWGNPGNGDDGAFKIGEDATSSNLTFFCLSGTTSQGGDNYGLFHIFGQRANGIVIDRCMIRFTGNSATAHQNTAGIYVVRASGTGTIAISRCDISGFPIGIYHKHGEEGRTTLSGGTVTDTLITATNRLNAGYNPAGWLYRNCILGTSNDDNYLAEEDGGAAGDSNEYEHVTFHRRLRLRAQGNGANNNKLTNCVLKDGLIIEAGSIRNTSDYNAWGAGAIINGGTLPTWRTANGSDAHSLQGALTFNGGPDPTVASYYKLTGLGMLAANDGKDMGADTQNIGVRAA